MAKCKPVSIFLFSLIVSLGGAARADTPGSDPAVKTMRQEFRAGRAPVTEDLALGHRWACAYRSAVAGSHQRSFDPDGYRFEQVEGSRGVRSTASSIGGYTFQSKSLVGTYSNNGKIFGLDHIRATADGRLMVEFTLPTCDAFACLFFGITGSPRAVDNYWQAVIGYRECRLAD